MRTAAENPELRLSAADRQIAIEKNGPDTTQPAAPFRVETRMAPFNNQLACLALAGRVAACLRAWRWLAGWPARLPAWLAG